MNADEHTIPAGWLDFYRATLRRKCEGLSDTELRTMSVPPSALSLLGLIQHMAEVERNWFRRVLIGEQTPPIYDPQADPDGVDGGFDLTDDITFEKAASIWEAEIAEARRNCADLDLSHTSPFMGDHVTLRWIYTHMTAEYARHCGHADLIRERIDGATGF